MDPFFSKQWTPSGEGYTGYLVDVVEEMSRIIPFPFEWVVVDKEEANGSRRKNGNRWTELTGKLLNGVIPFPFSHNNRLTCFITIDFVIGLHSRHTATIN